MKLSLTVFSVAFAAANAASFRASVPAPTGETLQTKVFLKGMAGEPTKEDMEVIGKALVSSYNMVDAGHRLTGVSTTKFEGLGQQCNYCHDDDASKANFAFSVVTPVGQQCNYCHDDDASMDTVLLANAAELEVSFCNKIRSSGSANLKAVSQCSLEFGQQCNYCHDDDAKAIAAPSTVATIDSTLILKGVRGDATSKAELATIAKAFVAAYNDVNWQSGAYLADAEIPFAAGTPLGQQCNYCHDDDASFGETLVLEIVTPVVSVGQQCNYCHDDDSADVAALKMDSFTKKALEVSFCAKLQASSSDKLRATQTCSLAMESIVATAAARTN